MPKDQGLLAVVALEHEFEFEEGAIEGSAIITHKLDQFGLDDEATKLDQVSRSFAAFHHPVSRISSCLMGLQAMMMGGCRPAQSFRAGL